MLTSILAIKPEDVDSVEKRRSYTICIVGCGKNGVLQACLFADAGFKVICADANQALVNNLTKGKSSFLKQEIELILRKHVKSGFIKATNDVKAAVAQSNIIILATEVELDGKGKINYASIESACKLIGSSLMKEALVIVSSIVGHGTTEGIIKEILERASGLKVGISLNLAYSPFQVFEDQTFEKIKESSRIVGGLDRSSTNSASAILETITRKPMVKAEDTKTVEAVALFEAMQRYAKQKIANEMAMFCEKAGLDYLKIQKLADAKGFELDFPTLESEKMRIELQMLLEEAENLNAKLRIAKTAQDVCEETLRHAVNLIRDALKTNGRTLRRARIALLGKPQLSYAIDKNQDSIGILASMLEKAGAKLRFYDPFFSGEVQIDEEHIIKKGLAEAVEGAECVVILANYEQFKRMNLKKLKALVRMPAAIVDLASVLEPEKVEMEGLTYRGLGRGVWKK